MRRRDFIGALSSAVLLPGSLQAQQASPPVVGYLSSGTRESDEMPYLIPFRQGLREMGYFEGRNVLIQYRWAEFQNDRLEQLAIDLVRYPVDVIATIGGSPPAFASKKNY
jgi:putative ABC transport system substrate-binding protein